MFVIMKTPRKLKRALIRIAGRTPMQRVLMHVAIALGASVQPLTKITPIVSSVVMSMAGLGTQLPYEMTETYVQKVSPPTAVAL